MVSVTVPGAGAGGTGARPSGRTDRSRTGAGPGGGPGVAPVHEDARGIVAPGRGLRRFSLDRTAPSPVVARFVDRYWVVRWDLTGEAPHTQQVLPHPGANVVLERGEAQVNGVSSRLTARTLTGVGRALGVMFRPGGFRPFLGRPLATITDTVGPAGALLDGALAELAGAMDVLDDAELVARVDAALAARSPAEHQPSEATTALVARLAADPAVVRVEGLAALVGLSPRQLQRRFADHVGLGPKAVIRRYRLFEAAEGARRRDPVDWAAVAAELGYADQSHLVRDFRSCFGLPPERYARTCAAPPTPAGTRPAPSRRPAG